MLLANGVSKFIINGKPAVIHGLKETEKVPFLATNFSGSYF